MNNPSPQLNIQAIARLSVTHYPNIHIIILTIQQEKQTTEHINIIFMQLTHHLIILYLSLSTMTNGMYLNELPGT